MSENLIMKQPETKLQQQFTVLQDKDGKFFRRGRYEAWASTQPTTRDEQIELFNIFEGNDDSVIGLKDCVGQVIEIQDVYTNPYSSLDEDTGEEIDGVLTYIRTPDTAMYVTSSKTFHNTLIRAINMFGINIKIKITSRKGQNGNIIGCCLVP